MLEQPPALDAVVAALVADGSRDVHPGRDFRPARQHEAAQLFERRVRLVAVGFQAVDRRLLDA